jgi:hypothetical protein
MLLQRMLLQRMLLQNLGMLVLGKAKLTISLSLLLNNLVDNCIKKLRFLTTILVLEIIADYQHYSIEATPK